jgi:MFS family permease
MKDDNKTGEIPLPITGTIPILRQWEDEAPPGPPPTKRWWILMVLAGGILTAMTFPGQTAGLSPLTDPLLEELAIDRTAISVSYLIATLAGATVMPFLGRLMDTYGTRRAIMLIGVTLTVVLFAASFVTEIFGLTASYVGLRMAGQGALTLAATTLVARSVTHRPGFALGLVGAIGSAGISLAPVGIERLIAWTDIATVWRIEAAIVLLIVVPIAIALPKDGPARTHTGTLIVPPRLPGYRVGQALKTGMFWVLSSAGFTLGMLATGLAFHLISILGEQGLSSSEAAANFIPQTVTALVATLGFGAIVDRIDPRWGIALSMLLLSGTLVYLPYVTTGLSGIAFGLLFGASMGALRGVEAAAFVRYFGRGHIGAIRGVATAIGLASTALGPLYFALGLAWTGSYVGPSVLAALLPALVALGALFARPPAPATTLVS